MTDSLPPPIYSQTDPDERSILQLEADDLGEGPHILIIPTGDAVNFQKGFLGAEGERAAIEGELQIKGIESDHWAKVTIALRTVEKAYELEIELGSSEVLLFSRTLATLIPFPSSFLFAIPLMADVPQSIQTANSSLSHHLTATLHPFDPLLPSHSRTLTVHTRRYISHAHTIPVHPETHQLEDPTRVEVQVPRTTFMAGESIPVYVTVPPPTTELVVDRGLRLRNVRAELVRNVKVKQTGEDDDGMIDRDSSIPSESEASMEELTDGPSSAIGERLFQPSSSKARFSPSSAGSSHRTIVARSGASCRFHSSRPVKLRFVLHHTLPSGSPVNPSVDLPTGDYGHYDSDAECPSITQFTILHSITFRVFVYISFVDMTTRRERISTLSIPITVLAPPAPLPQVSHQIDVAYQKKHDQPPLKTVRQDDIDHPIPRYSEGEAGPSMLQNSAPPPFEERDAPPPFSLDEAGASTSARLPTFLESESEIIIPDRESQLSEHPPSPAILGEGIDFGFLSSEQFDGHTEPMERSMTPPPTLEMATRDADLTQLADIREPQRAMEVLGLALDRHDESLSGERPPPPPPAMDDPSDPPPSIDSEFRSPDMPRQTASPPHASPNLHPVFTPNELPPSSPTPTSREPLSTHGHAPPPYLVPGNHTDQENVARPPPYMD
ncbi:hypothetical protein D9615_005272 [Tricholomella constricta]|uniref:Uncharacterized protein n=1 Tax=Tricholomella constricta TaxID=117010 RepID=A0A8H5H6Q9_9AGAR|nr:hypothetical protein D9615_005272 [Tricholomella constricta]